MTDSREYAAIAHYYGTRTAKRSGVLLLRHVDHGLAILDATGATVEAKRAFCLHPLVQADADLAAHAAQVAALGDAYVAMLAIEYRHIANAALSTRVVTAASEIALSPLAEVNDMLIADKVQNRSDFERHHRATHARADALDRYFRLWLERLGISEARYRELAGLMSP